jgi:hypothetical protein
MKRLYENLLGPPKDGPKPEVLQLYLREQQLDVANMKSTMNVSESADKPPLYLVALDNILRKMAMDKGDAAGLDHNLFLRKLKEQKFTSSQVVPLQLRLNMLDSFLDFSSRSRDRYYKDFLYFEQGNLTITDLSYPFAHEKDVCTLFKICLSLFLETRLQCGRMVALDEAHKVRNRSPYAHKSGTNHPAFSRQIW